MSVRLVWLVILLYSDVGVAQQLHVVINGKAYHFDNKRDWNEKNYGLGFEYDFAPRGNWIPLLTGSSFKDSNSHTSRYLGAGIKRRFLFGKDPKGLHLDVGVVGFAMTRRDYNNNDPFLGALPFVSLGNEFVAINATYIPKVHPKFVSLLYFQLMIRLAEF